MKTLEKSQDKIQKISDQLRREILEPAHEEAKKIIENAKKKAAHINAEAEKQADELIHAGRKAIEQERNVFHSSLQQSFKQVIEALRQAVEHDLFNKQLYQMINQSAANPEVIANLIKAMIESIKQEGVSADLSAVIPKTASAQEINHLLGEHLLKRLQEKSVVLGDFNGGAKVKLIDKNLTIDISEETLVDLISRYIRKDFRKLIFGSGQA